MTAPPRTVLSDRVLLASARHRAEFDVSAVARASRQRTGAVAVRAQAGAVRRAEPGPVGPLVLEARTAAGEVLCEVWGPARTPATTADRALEACAAWVGLRDDPGALREIVASSQVLSRLLRQLGEVRLGALPRVGEALGRAVLEQLVQGVEATRSAAQVAACAGEDTGSGLWTWPTAAQLGAVPAWTLRRCGVSLRGARSLHTGALADRRLTEAVGDWALLDRRLRALPGVGVWTSAETRLALGDPDATAVGDYHLPGIVGCVLGAGARGDHEWDDAAMLELLAPFAGQRGRVILLCELAGRRRLAPRPARRAPRAALSAHRYW